MFPDDEKVRRLKTLTKKEMEVVFWSVRGKSDPDIALILGGIALKTVADRRTGLYKKLGMDQLKDHEKPDFLVREYSQAVNEVVPDEATLNLYAPTPSIPTPEPPVGPLVPTKKRRPPWMVPLISGGCLMAVLGVGVLYGLIQAGLVTFQSPLRSTATPITPQVVVITATFPPPPAETATGVLADTPIPSDTAL